MKLKYYMRGLGIGIILTTLIFVIGNNEKELTDQQIMERAKALGMELKEENNENLEDILSSIGPTEGAEQPFEAPTDAPTMGPKVSNTPTATVAPTVTEAPIVTEAPTPTATPTPTVTPTPTKSPQKSNQEGDLGKISFTISKGMSSGQVAKLLVEKGLIKDADDFNKYIVKIGKAGNIRIGSYSVSEGTTYEDIVDIITSRQ